MGAEGVNVDADKLRVLKAGLSRKRAEKGEVEGSRPRVRKPEIRVNAPPGGVSSFSPDLTVDDMRQADGRKHFPEAGGKGCNRDPCAVNELRYFQEECGGVGRQHVQISTRASQRDCEQQRYHLDDDDKVLRVPRKAQCKQAHANSSALPIFSPPCRSSQSTCVGSEEYGGHHCDVNSQDSLTDLDDLPLGAEWCTWQNGECEAAY